MMKNHLFRNAGSRSPLPLLWCLLLPIPLVGGTPVLAQAPPASADMPSGPLRLRDTVGVQVVGEAALSGPFTLAANGTLTLPLIGSVKVLGMTPAQAASAIATTYKQKKILRNPQVIVTILSRPKSTVSLAGALERQVVVTIGESTRLNEVLEPAGILTTADLNKVIIARGDRQIVVDYFAYRSGNDAPDGPHNPLLEDGDKIYVRARIQVVGIVKINGEVRNPQATNLIEKTTVFQAIQGAGGVTELADRDKIIILRGGVEIPVPYKAIQDGTQKDIALQDKDEIFVRRVGSVKLNGEVKNPQTANLIGKTTVFQAIQGAGGVTELADRDKIIILRGGVEIPVPYKAIQDGRTEKDIALQDKDEIFVRKIEKPQMFFVTGGVAKASSFPIAGDITLNEAIATAGGTLPRVDLKKVSIQRKSPGGQIETKTYDLTLAADMATPIKPEDVISVPYPKGQKTSIFSVLGSLSGLFFLLRR